MTVAVLDIGKTNLKLVVVDAAGRTLHRASRPNVPLAGPPYPHPDVEGILGWYVEALAATPDRGAIDTLVPVTHGCTAALVAGDRLAMPVLDYEHDGPDATGAGFAAAADPFSESRSPTLPVGFTLGRQIYWQARAFPEAFGRVTDILMYPQYWSWRLTGVKASEVTSLGCHTGLWRPAARDYSRLVQREGWRARMPPLRPAWEPLGPLLPALAAATGLSPACRVLCGVHDSNASYLAHLATRQAPFAVLSSGTWLIIMAAGGDIARLDAGRDMLANVDVNGDPVPTARFMGGREFAAVAGPESAGVEPDLAVATRLIAQGTMALPSFAPESGPFIGRRGSLVGPPPESPAERVALASLYNALVADLMLELLGAEGPRIVEGPFAGNPVFLGALAGLEPGWPVIASTDASGTSAGAELLAHWPPQVPPAGEGTGAPPLAGMPAYRAAWRAKLG
jgi:sugar (pentulose or hexulose) kinase